MMLGAAGAMLCMATGTVIGVCMRDRRQARLRFLECEVDLLTGMRLLLLQERMAMGELLLECAALVPQHSHAIRVGERFRLTAEELGRDPLGGLAGAYAKACERIPAPWEQGEEKEAFSMLFAQLGNGTAAMREQAVASCLRRLKPVADHARVKAETGGKLCMQLGMLLGLMAGVALW